jgi:flagellin-specific chaperone FliS
MNPASLPSGFYLRNELRAASPDQMHVMLLERCQRAVADVMRHTTVPCPEKRLEALQKAMDILGFLVLSLPSGGDEETVAFWGGLYMVCLDKLNQMGVEKNGQAGPRILAILEPAIQALRERSAPSA